MAIGETRIFWRAALLRCRKKIFFGASGDAPFGFSACFSLASFS
jgi:hypothetical protein